MAFSVHWSEITSKLSSARQHPQIIVDDQLVSRQKQQRLEERSAEERGRRRRQVLAVVQVVFALDHRELLEDRRVFAVECLHVDVIAADCHESEEENVAVDRVRSLDATRLQLVPLVREALDGRHQVVAANRGNYLLNRSVLGRFS